MLCAICLDTTQCGAGFKLQCGHMFGTSCLAKWSSKTSKQTCPFCRHPISPTNILTLNALAGAGNVDKETLDHLSEYLYDSDSLQEESYAWP